MSATIALGVRSLREAVRQPDALFMTMFIPIFFLVVNTGQAAEIFPSDSTGFLEGLVMLLLNVRMIRSYD